MGKSPSKVKTDLTDDKDVTVIVNQEIHSEYHEGHEWKLIIILAVVVLQFAFTLYRWHSKRVAKRAFLRARSSLAVLDKA